MTSASCLRVAVIGAGPAGRSFALACVQAGLGVVLEDVMPARLRNARAELANVGKAVALVSTVEDAVEDADIAVDFVPDELESKLEIWSLIDRMAPPRTILCTPSEVLSITDLASCTYRRDRCIMLRNLASAVATRALPVRMLHDRLVAAQTLQLTREMLSALGLPVTAEPDPDLPMLIKNMGYTAAEKDSAI